jgi:signal recognition particle GTPase
MNERKSMTKRDRELALGEAVLVFSHTAHHVGADAEPEIFSRVDAALAVAATAGLISSLVSSVEPPALDAKKVDSGSVQIAGTDTSSNELTSSRARIEKAIEHFRQRPANRAKTTNGLRSVLDSLFKKKVGEAQLDELIKELITKNVIVETAGKLTYRLPSA